MYFSFSVILYQEIILRSKFKNTTKPEFIVPTTKLWLNLMYCSTSGALLEYLVGKRCSKIIKEMPDATMLFLCGQVSGIKRYSTQSSTQPRGYPPTACSGHYQAQPCRIFHWRIHSFYQYLREVNSDSSYRFLVKQAKAALLWNIDCFYGVNIDQ